MVGLTEVINHLAEQLPTAVWPDGVLDVTIDRITRGPILELDDVLQIYARVTAEHEDESMKDAVYTELERMVEGINFDGTTATIVGFLYTDRHEDYED